MNSKMKKPYRELRRLLGNPDYRTILELTCPRFHELYCIYKGKHEPTELNDIKKDLIYVKWILKVKK